MKRIYLSGPMAGKPDLNREAFSRAESEFSANGFDVVNPHAISCEVMRNYALRWNFLTDDEKYRLFLGHDLLNLCKCDEAHFLKGWQYSTGANMEHSIAIGLKLDVTYES